ncbi:hypothetical protein ACROYT_G000485 [Oculina patagonica]
MADNLIEKESKETNWFSAELRILEAEYEKSKLQVYQDTLFCKRSMVELELLCKNEQLRKNVRVNNKLKEDDSRLKEQLQSLSSELQTATSQLQTAQNTLKDEKDQRQLEKKELEDKLNSEMQRKMEKHRESASKRERLLQEEVKTWQDKHVKVFKEAEDLRTELSKKNVAVKTKAIQAMVNVKNASTMVQVESQSCDVGVQVQDLASGDDRSRKDDDDARESDEDLRETNDTGKEKEDVIEAKEKKSKKGMVKENKPETDKRKSAKTNKNRVKEKNKQVQKSKRVNKYKENEDEMIGKKTDNKRKVSRKRKASQSESQVTTQNETKKLPEKQTTTQEEQQQSAKQAETQAEFHEQRTNSSNSWLAPGASQEDDIPFQYSTTPGRLQKEEEESKRLEKPGDQTGDSVQDGVSGSIEVINHSKKGSKVDPKDLPQLSVCIEDISKEENEDEGKVTEQDLQDHKSGDVAIPSQEQSVENENVTPEEQKSALIEEDPELLGLNKAEIQLQDKEELPVPEAGKTDVCKDLQGEELTGVQDVNKKMGKRCKGKKDSNKKTKSKTN